MHVKTLEIHLKGYSRAKAEPMSNLKAMGEGRGQFFLYFFSFLLDFIVVAINLIQLLAAILRINYLSIYREG